MSDMQSFPREAPVEEAKPAKRKPGRPKKQPINEETVQKVSKMAKEEKAKDTAEERAKKYRQIRQYYEQLGDRIRYVPPRNLSADSSDELLDEVLLNIRYDLGSTSGLALAKLVYANVISGVEYASRQPAFAKYGINVSAPFSLAASVQTPESMAELEPILKELVIEYEALFVTGPVKRLITTTAAIAMRVSAANKAQQHAQVPETAVVDEEAALLAELEQKSKQEA